ncbi:hypothetical protein SRHO_G00281320 [Serrasalmus rhombeus]
MTIWDGQNTVGSELFLKADLFSFQRTEARGVNPRGLVFRCCSSSGGNPERLSLSTGSAPTESARRRSAETHPDKVTVPLVRSGYQTRAEQHDNKRRWSSTRR